MSGYASQMKAAVEGATGMVVYPDGTVDYQVAGTWTAAQLTKLHDTQAKIQGILGKANELDTTTQQKLLSYMLIYAGMKLKVPPLAGSAGTAAGAQTGTVAGPAASAGTSSTTATHAPSDQQAPSSSPSPAVGPGII